MVAQRLLPCSNTGASLPVDAVAYQNQADSEVEALWRYVAAPLTNIGGTANAVTASSDSAVVGPITAYRAGQKFTIVPTLTNTGGVTLNVDGLGVLNMLDQDGNAILSGSWAAGRRYLIECTGTDFRVLAGGILSANLFPSTAPDLILQDQKTQNTAGGTFTSGAWQQRTINTVVRNNIAGASLSANQFTLPAGTFYIRWSCPAAICNHHQSRLQNVTDNTTIALGSSEYVSTTVQSDSGGDAYITLTTSKVFEIDHQCSTTGTTFGFGEPANFSTEVYTIVEVFKVGTLTSQVVGQPGGAITIPYSIDLSSVADADPGAGLLRFNNAQQNLATVLFVDLQSNQLVDQTTVLDQLDASSSVIKGQLRIAGFTDTTKFLDFNFTARNVGSGYRKLSVTPVASSTNNPFLNGDKVVFAFTRNGDAGPSGGQGWSYNFNSSTSNADPGSGNLAVNNATLSSVTALYISKTDSLGNAIGTALATWDSSSSTVKGRIKVSKTNSPTNFLVLDINGAKTDNTTWFSFPVNYVTSGGSFSNTDQLTLIFTPKGDQGSAAMVLLNTITISGTPTSVSDLTSLTNAYSRYRIEFDNILPTTNAVQLELQVHRAGDAAGTFITASYQTAAIGADGTATTFIAEFATTFIPLSRGALGNVSNSGSGMSGWIEAHNPSQTVSPKSWEGQVTYINTNVGGVSIYKVAGQYTGGNQAIDGFRVLPSGGGTLASGTVRVYGVT